MRRCSGVLTFLFFSLHLSTSSFVLLCFACCPQQIDRHFSHSPQRLAEIGDSGHKPAERQRSAAPPAPLRHADGRQQPTERHSARAILRRPARHSFTRPVVQSAGGRDSLCGRPHPSVPDFFSVVQPILRTAAGEHHSKFGQPREQAQTYTRGI